MPCPLWLVRAPTCQGIIVRVGGARQLGDDEQAVDEQACGVGRPQQPAGQAWAGRERGQGGKTAGRVAKCNHSSAAVAGMRACRVGVWWRRHHDNQLHLCPPPACLPVASCLSACNLLPARRCTSAATQGHGMPHTLSPVHHCWRHAPRLHIQRHQPVARHDQPRQQAHRRCQLITASWRGANGCH